MKTFYFLILLLIYGLFACSKDRFPDEFSLTGAWIEHSANNAKSELVFKTGNRLYLRLRQDAVFDTLMYKLNRNDAIQIFEPEDYPEGKYKLHAIAYNSKVGELTVSGLYPLSGNQTNETVFVRK